MNTLPAVTEVRHRIEKCKDKDIQLYLKTVYLCCARGIEIAGELTSTDRKRHTEPYGPMGTDVHIAETEAPDIPTNQLAELLIAAMADPKKAMAEIAEMKKKIPVAVFKIPIAKQHLEKGEEYPYRLVALPLNPKYEPWAQEIYDRFQKAGADRVFHFNRQSVWEYLTRKDPIFAGTVYRIKKYHYMKDGTIAFIDRDAEDPENVCLSHRRIFKAHALRHVRTDELLKVYGFDGFDLGAYVGWSLGGIKQMAASPNQANNYAEIREAWPRYIKKLCKPNLYQPSDWFASKGGN